MAADTPREQRILAEGFEGLKRQHRFSSECQTQAPLSAHPFLRLNLPALTVLPYVC
jgi:hypothetical protein